MSNKLQELTDKLYNEGLSKGKEEGDRYLQNAKEQADKLISEAKQAAKETMEKAAKEAEALKAKAQADIRTASQQCLEASKKDIENLLIASALNEKVDKAMADPDFVKQIIKTVAERFSANEPQDINLILSDKLKDSTESWIKDTLSKELGKGIKAEFSKKISGGFTIGPADGSYFISLSDDSFKELIAEYLRPVTRKILFGA